jgi:hypothetical protein
MTQTTETTKQQSRYVRLSLTVLYHVSDCYGGKGKPDPLSDACIYCFLKKQCQERQEVVWR